MSLEQFLARQKQHTPIVCVQGIGFVGVALLAAVARARRDGEFRFGAIGKDLDSQALKIDAILQGKSPIRSTDRDLEIALQTGVREGNLFATTDPSVLRATEILLICVPVDYDHDTDQVKFDVLKSAIKEANEHLRDGALAIVLSTVPPGTCERLIRPLLRDTIDLAHSYERVTPGPKYLESITEAKRVFAGATPWAAKRCREFWSDVVANPRENLMELSSMTASEAAKLVENSYRAVNIAFVQEWARYCENNGIDFDEIAGAVRARPSHTNLLQPRVGVGGYCLTKDPMLAAAVNAPLPSAKDRFPFCDLALRTNQDTPRQVAEWLSERMGGLAAKRVHVLGYSYAPNVGDARFSPTKSLVDAMAGMRAFVDWSDPFLDANGEPGAAEPPETFEGYDCVFVAVCHAEYTDNRFWKKRLVTGLVVADGSGLPVEMGKFFPDHCVSSFRIGSGKGGARATSQG